MFDDHTRRTRVVQFSPREYSNICVLLATVLLAMAKPEHVSSQAMIPIGSDSTYHRQWRTGVDVIAAWRDDEL